MRLQLSHLPDAILERFVKKDFLKEGYALELGKLSIFDNLAPWLDQETAIVYHFLPGFGLAARANAFDIYSNISYNKQRSES